VKPKDRPGNSVAAERRQAAFELRLKGCSYREIGRELGMSHSNAELLIKQTLAERKETTGLLADQLRDMELARIDKISGELWANRAEPSAAATLLRCIERRSKLLGLDAPTKLDHTFDPTQVQSVLGFAVGGAVQMVGELRQAVLSLVADDEARSALVMVFDEREQAYVSEFEARAAAALPSGQEAAA
jgi:hypothetical protein